MMTPSSTSQSVLTDLRGISTVSLGPPNGAGGLHEDDRFLGDFRAGLGGVIGIVETDADEFADLPDASADAASLEFRQGLRIDGCNLFQAFGATAPRRQCL